jgi:recombination protein RecA
MAKKKVVEEIKGDRSEKLSAVVKGAIKEYGRSVLVSARDSVSLAVPRVGTSLYGLDVSSNGGFPMGRITLLYGPKSGGKTTLYLRGLAKAQRLCANCAKPGEFEEGEIDLPNLETGEIEKVKTQVIVNCPCGNPRDLISLWIDAEGVWLPSWGEKMGVLTEKVILMRPTYGEQAYDVVTAFVSVKEIDLIVIDSIAAITPIVEYTSSMREQQQGVAARLNNKFIRKIVSGMNDSFQTNRPITLWMVNQYREKIGVMFGSPETLPGGKGQGFATSLEVELRPGKISIDDATGEPLFGEFNYVVKKNKVGVSGGKGTFRQCMADTDVFVVGDLMEHEVVIEKAVEMGFIEHDKVMYEYANQTFRGLSQTVKFFGENPHLFEELKERMIRLKLRMDEAEDD